MEPIEILKDLIARPSVNPMGRSVAGPEFFEGRMTEYLVAFFARLGVPFQRIEVVPGRATSLHGSIGPAATGRFCSTRTRTPCPSTG